MITDKFYRDLINQSLFQACFSNVLSDLCKEILSTITIYILRKID